MDKTTILKLPFQPPFNWEKMMAFLNFRAIPGVESINKDTYKRSIEIDGTRGIISISPDVPENSLSLEIEFPDKGKLSQITRTVERLFDLAASSRHIDDTLKKDKTLSPLILNSPGIRVPGCFNYFELCIRAIIGQQISVKGATTIIGRVAQKYGTRLNIKNRSGLEYIFPGPDILSHASFEGIGLTRTRIETIHQFSTAVKHKNILFKPLPDPHELRASLKSIKGIGDWTAQYISMRTIKDPDAFPLADLGLLKAVSSDESPVPKKTLKTMSEKWKPYRAYAAMYLWDSL